MKKILLTFGVLFVFLNANAQSDRFIVLFRNDVSQAREHKKVQNERSFETWEKNQPKVRIEAVKAAVEQSNTNSKSNKSKRRLKNKETRIRNRIKN